MDHGQCLSQETLTDYLEGGLDPAMKTIAEVHLLACDTCRESLASFMKILDEEVRPEEAAVVELASDRWSNTKVARSMAERPTGTHKRWFLGLVAIFIVCVVALQFVLDQTAEPASGEEVVSLLLAQERPFEGRLSGQPYLPFLRTRDSQTGVAYGVLAGEMTRLGADSYQMGRFYLIHKDFIKALSYLEMAEREVGARPEFHNDLGTAYLEAGGDGFLGKAGEEFRHALQADPEFVPAAFNLAIFYERTGLLSEARSQLERFLELDPNSEWAGEARAKLEGLSR